jgi:hypothetical protein
MSDKEFEEGWGYKTWDASRMNRDEKLCRIIHLLEIIVRNQGVKE